MMVDKPSCFNPHCIRSAGPVLKHMVSQLGSLVSSQETHLEG